jgi:hypothetical protein
LFDCEFYDADATVCLAKNVEGRKYEWIQYEDGTVLGSKAGQCQKGIIYWKNVSVTFVLLNPGDLLG